MNLPNRITLSRIFLIPVFIVVFFLDVIPHGYNYIAAAAVFGVASFTDFLDGHIARKRGLVTNLGKFLDPIADKVLVSTALILMLVRGAEIFQVLWAQDWVLIAAGCCVAVILARELIVSGFRMVAASAGLVLAADKIGKFKTVFQDIAIRRRRVTCSTGSDWRLSRSLRSLRSGLAFRISSVTVLFCRKKVRGKRVSHEKCLHFCPEHQRLV